VSSSQCSRRLIRPLFNADSSEQAHELVSDALERLRKPLPKIARLLVERGLTGVQLVVSDAHAGLKKAIGQVLLGSFGLLHDRDQRPLGAPARLEEAREVAAATDLRDRELDLARPRLPRSRAVAVAMGEPLLRCPLAASSTSSDTSASISCCTTQLNDARRKSSPSPSSR